MSLVEQGALPEAVQQEFKEIESTKANKGYTYRQNLTNLIEGVMVRPEDGGKGLLRRYFNYVPQSVYESAEKTPR